MQIIICVWKRRKNNFNHTACSHMIPRALSLSSLWILPWKKKCCVLCICAQLCPTLCGPMDCSPPGSSVHGIFQVSILEWVPMSSSRGSSQLRDQAWDSRVSCIGRQSLYHHCTIWEVWTKKVEPLSTSEKSSSCSALFCINKAEAFRYILLI